MDVKFVKNEFCLNVLIRIINVDPIDDDREEGVAANGGGLKRGLGGTELQGYSFPKTSQTHLMGEGGFGITSGLQDDAIWLGDELQDGGSRKKRTKNGGYSPDVGTWF